MKKLGLIINPIAGMGGSVGLKGTDGVLEKALELGAVPQAPFRTEKALEILFDIKENMEILTCTGAMGEDTAKKFGFNTRVVYWLKESKTGSVDTVEAATAMLNESADLILFAGGDGTARDIYRAIKDKVVVIGIPAGVKIHSPVYAINPSKAGELAKLFIMEKVTATQESEVLDIDEEAYRRGKVITSLYGYLKVPYERKYIQNRKAGTPISEKTGQHLISLDIIDNMQYGIYYIIGPGTTTRPIMDNLNLPNTLLGVDVILNKKLFMNDAAEKQLLEIINEKNCRIVITPIGGQGYLFGRGNQQISKNVLSKLKKNNLIVVSTKQKISELHGNPFLIDTGDSYIDKKFNGYIKVVTGFKEAMMYRIES